jgi:membrane associated rhomboid family serine protease
MAARVSARPPARSHDPRIVPASRRTRAASRVLTRLLGDATVYGRGYQSPGLGIGPPVTPPIVKQLLIANAAIFVAQLLVGERAAISLFGVSPAAFWQHLYLWQPFTYMWLHGGLGHLLMNLFSLWMFGSPLAMAWGAQRFLRYYLLCGVGAGFIIATYPYLGVVLGLASPASLGYLTLGASGAIFGVLLAYSLTWPDRTIMLLFPPIPIKAIWFIPFLFLMEFLFGPPNVSHVGHLGGVLVGWILFRRANRLPLLPSKDQILYRWRRYKMRRQLYEVRREQERSWRDRDNRLH